MIAHIHGKTGVQQPLSEHLLHTAEIAKEIGDSMNLGYLSFLTGYFHDLGKARNQFTDYILAAACQSGQAKRGSVDHSSAGGIYIYNRYYKNDTTQKLAAQLIAQAIFSHHGLMDCLGIDGTPVFHNRLEKKEEIDYDEVVRNMNDIIFSVQEIDNIFQKALMEVAAIEQKAEKFPLAMKEKAVTYRTYFWSVHQRLLLSILIDADRLDTAIFCGSREPQEKRNVDIWERPLQHLEKYLKRFECHNSISILRKEISEDCLAASAGKGGIFRLSVPTGGGKTLASLRYGIHHAKKYGKKRILYTAPFLSILEQNAQVFREALGDDIYILEHHSNLIEDEITEESSGKSDRRYLTENWDTSFIATTSVQLLNTLFSDSTQSIRRFHNLAEAVIIIDEIQALPLKMIANFNLMLNYLHSIMGATIVLCSATQPLIETVEYPVLFSENKDIIKDYNRLYKKLKRVELSPIANLKDSVALRRFTDGLMCSHNHILIILNTKAAVQKVYQELYTFYEVSGQQIRLLHLSTNMCPQHRLAVIGEIKSTSASQRLICVSTNLIEAGVDISFSCVIRSYAGLDSIAQAAGRCNRNGEIKEGFGKVYLIHMEEEYLGRLAHIRRGALCSEDITADFEHSPEAYDYDLLSPRSMEFYYRNYFYGDEQKHTMRYSIKDTGRNLVDLLSENRESMQAYYNRYGKTLPNQMLFQSFKYAGKQFKAIDSDTVSVLVPYEKGEELIAELNKTVSDVQLIQLLRNAQRFTVNLYRYQIEKFVQAGALISLLDGSLFALKDGFYDNEIGITYDGYMNFLTVD